MEIFNIPVLYKRNKSDIGVRAILPVDELLYLRVIGKYIYFYGNHRKEYVLQSAFADWRILLDGLGFDEVDRGTLVNANRIQFIYRDLQQIHFDERADGVFCPIAHAHIARMRKAYPQIELRTSE